MGVNTGIASSGHMLATQPNHVEEKLHAELGGGVTLGLA
jgi:hypothetical protein